jgi:phosphomannomutase
MSELAARARAWTAADPDPQAAAQVQALVDAGDTAGLTALFGGRLSFGTAGLRGPLRPGPDGMNRAVVRRAAFGVARWVLGRPDPSVVVGYDARHGSRDFAIDSCRVLAGAGVRARLLPGPLPTPVLAFAVRHLGASAGVMVTASHNPAQDNGYKVYGADGAQIISPADREIESAIEAAGAANELPVSDAYEVLGDEVLEAYLTAITGLVRNSARELSVAYTPLHGVGGAVLLSAFARAGFGAPIVEPSQAEPDPDFPTAAFPNPEEPGVLDRVLALDPTVDLVLANDPDADRLAVACSGRVLTGDEVGVLLADHLIRTRPHDPGVVATTVVSSSLLQRIADATGVPYAETLTGFKWIMRAGDPIRFGYEEALGYAVAPDIVRDKDGISAALIFAELAAELKAAGRTVLDRLDVLAVSFGVHATAQLSVRVDDQAEIAGMMARLRAADLTALAGRTVVERRDLLTGPGDLPASDLMLLRLDGGKVVVRPSGTEPKLKAYLEVVEQPTTDVAAARSRAESAVADLQSAVSSLLKGQARE